MKITTPRMSNRRQRCSMCCEWFIKVWYAVDNDKQMTADNMKIKKSNEISASNLGRSAGKILLHVPLAEQEGNGRDEVGIDVD